MKKRVFLTVLCLAFVAGSLGGSASASNILVEKSDGNEMSLQYAYLNTISPGLSISGKTANAYATISGLSSVTKIEYTVYLESKTRSRWSNAISWTGSSNGTRATYSFSTSVTSGKTYRTKTVAKIYSGSNSETVTAYSMEKIA